MNADNRHLGPQPLDDTRLDSVIDVVAREMTDGEPSGALRARVLDEIAREQQLPGFALPRWAWAGAAAALIVAVATSIWLVRPVPLPGGTPTTAARQQVAEPGAVPREDAAAAAPADTTAVSPSAPSGRVVSRAAVRVTAAEPVDAARHSHQLPALAAIEPLRFTAVEPVALQVQSMEVAPLADMSSIQIPSLDRGSSDTESADPKKEN
jgi:hypothetical protein